MTPYYQDDYCTIYHGDCRDMAVLGDFDLVLTDPPYGLSEKWQGGTWGAAQKYKDARRWDKKVDDETIWNCVLKGKDAVVWVANNYAISPPTLAIVAGAEKDAIRTLPSS